MKPWLKNRVQKSAYSNIFQELRFKRPRRVPTIFTYENRYIHSNFIEQLLRPNKLITTSFLGLLVCGDEFKLIELNCSLGTTGKSKTLYYETNKTLKGTS